MARALPIKSLTFLWTLLHLAKPFYALSTTERERYAKAQL